MFTETKTETVHEAPIGRLISAIVTRLNPLAQMPKAPATPLEYRSTRRLVSSLTASDIGATISTPSGARGTITALTRFVQDGEHFIQINASGSIVRTCRLGTEIVTWAWEAPRQPVLVRTTPTELAEYRVRSEAERRDRLAEEEAHRPARRAPRALTGYFAGMAA